MSQVPAPILICYDGSDDARRAIDFAAESYPGRRAIVLSIWESLAVIAVRYPLAIFPATDDTPLEEHAQQVAAEGAERARTAGLDASALAVSAPVGVAESIIDVADDKDVALIVVGTRGLTGVRSVLLGSVSHAVAQHARRPLLIVPSKPLAEARALVAPRP